MARYNSRRSTTVVAAGNGHLRKCWHCQRQRNHTLMRRLVRGIWVCQDKESCRAKLAAAV